MSLRPGAVNFKEKWGGLRETIIAVVRLTPVNTVTWNDHYSDIYALCEAFPEPYADRLFAETEDLLHGFVTELHEVLAGQSSLALLRGYQQHWLRYQQGAKFLDSLFSYFNRVALRKYLPAQINTWPDSMKGAASDPGTTPTKGVPIQIRHMALRVWKEGFLEKMREQVVAALLHEVKRERDGEEVDIGTIRDVLASFIEVEEACPRGSLGYYQDCFESPFLEETGQYYRGMASGMVVQLSYSQYMCRVVARLQAAKNTGTRYLHPTTITKFIRECEARLVVDYKDDYLYLHTRAMVRQENSEDLANLYLLLHSIPKAIQPLVTEFQAHIQEQALLITVIQDLMLFDAFYIGKHSGRTLTWLHHQSLAELHLTYLKKPYTVCVTSYQMVVLYAYNEGDRYSLASLGQCTQLPLQDLSSILQSLLDCKLLLEVEEEVCGSATSISTKNYLLNKDYFNKRTKFKVTASTQKDSQQEIERTVYSVTEDRKLFIQAAIVRVMKARKNLQHNQLIQETISQVRSRFTPSIHMIKRCIEALMEKQYLQRLDSSRETYQYMA